MNDSGDQRQLMRFFSLQRNFLVWMRKVEILIFVPASLIMIRLISLLKYSTKRVKKKKYFHYRFAVARIAKLPIFETFSTHTSAEERVFFSNSKLGGNFSRFPILIRLNFPFLSYFHWAFSLCVAARSIFMTKKNLISKICVWFGSYHVRIFGWLSHQSIVWSGKATIHWQEINQSEVKKRKFGRRENCQIDTGRLKSRELSKKKTKRIFESMNKCEGEKFSADLNFCSTFNSNLVQWKISTSPIHHNMSLTH